MPDEDNKILKHNHGEKSIKAYLCWLTRECLLQKMHSCQNDPEKGKDCMERFCKDVREHAMLIINYEKKEVIPLTDKENKSYEKQKVYYICKKELSTDENKKTEFKLYHKVKDHCHYTGKFREADIKHQKKFP